MEAARYNTLQPTKTYAMEELVLTGFTNDGGQTIIRWPRSAVDIRIEEIEQDYFLDDNDKDELLTDEALQEYANDEMPTDATGFKEVLIDWFDFNEDDEGFVTGTYRGENSEGIEPVFSVSEDISSHILEHVTALVHYCRLLGVDPIKHIECEIKDCQEVMQKNLSEQAVPITGILVPADPDNVYQGETNKDPRNYTVNDFDQS